MCFYHSRTIQSQSPNTTCKDKEHCYFPQSTYQTCIIIIFAHLLLLLYCKIKSVNHVMCFPSLIGPTCNSMVVTSVTSCLLQKASIQTSARISQNIFFSKRNYLQKEGVFFLKEIFSSKSFFFFNKMCIFSALTTTHIGIGRMCVKNEMMIGLISFP